ncbi:DUF3261 domain-containing protein [Cysteiniphilum halobium]|uniref:DUF3261 domain-containing protein n=1 Tax=Cysteiniphilum halobium TaxID=2219059 RepID=UPI000E65367A|nr:DUF3261 domain-containing protein [Cysteiniphilum halobium]
MKRLSYFRNILILGLCSILLSSCALLQTHVVNTPEVEVFKSQNLRLPTPNKLDLHFNVTQILSSEYTIKGKKESYIAQVEVEASKQKIVIVAAAGWGGSIFSLVYDGVSIDSSSLPMPHADMGVKQSLVDFIFTYAPTKVIKEILQTTNIKIQVQKNLRQFYLNGQLVMQINYQNQQDLYADVTLENFVYHYQIVIKTLKR